MSLLYNKKLKLFLCVYSLNVICLYAMPMDISLPIYDYLHRLEMQSFISKGHLNSLPLAKTEIQNLLQEAEVNSEKLSAHELVEWELYANEFFPERRKKITPLYYADSSVELQGQVEYYTGGFYRDSLPHADAFAFGSFNPTLEGSWNKNLNFIATAGIGQEKSHYARFHENYDPQLGMPYNTSRAGKSDSGKAQKASTFDDFRTVIGYESSSLRFEAGNDWNQWGPGHWQHLTFSQKPWFWVQDSLKASPAANYEGSSHHGWSRAGEYRRGYRYPGESSPMTQIRLVFGGKRWKYTKFMAQKTGLSSDSIAYIIAHRLDIRVTDNWNIGLHELVATSGRNPELTYLIPLIPLKYAEHQLGDRDNIALGLDMEYYFLNRARIYGELFLDDFIDFRPDYWGNKIAFMLGFEWLNPFWKNSQLFTEYSRVEPWLFTHQRYNNQLQHFGSLLGSEIPANSHILHLQFNQFLPAQSHIGFEYSFMQRNVIDRGSLVFDVHADSIDGTSKVFLGPNPETRNNFSLLGGYRWKRYVELNAAAGYLWVSNWKNKNEDLSTLTLASEIKLHY